MRLEWVMVAALAGWASMLLIGTLTWGFDVAARGHHSADEPLTELVSLFAVIAAVPFAVVVLAVFTPALILTRRWLTRSWMPCAVVGLATAPVAGLSLLLAGHWLFRDASAHRQVLSELQTIMWDPLAAVPWLLALSVGGVVQGLVFSRSACDAPMNGREDR